MHNFFLALKNAGKNFVNDNCPRLAAALSYYTAFSLAPLLVILIGVSGYVWDPNDIQGAIYTEIESVLGHDGANQIKTMLASEDNKSRKGWAGLLSALLLFIGATSLVGQLQTAMNEVWQVMPDPSQSTVKNFLKKRVFSFGMICGLGFLLIVSLVISTILSAAGSAISAHITGDVSKLLLQSINIIASFILFAMIFAFMYRYLPDARIKWRYVMTGALLTAFLFVAGKFAIGAYLGSKNMNSAYGAAGSLALMLVWVNYSAMILLFGCEFTQACSQIRGAGVKPAKGAVRVQEKIIYDPS